MSLPGEPEGEEPAGPEQDRIGLLLVSQDPVATRRITQMLTGAGRARFEITEVAVVEDALEQLQTGTFAALLLDLSVHEGYGLDSLYRAQVAARSVPIVVLAYQDDEELAIRAARAGAQDYLIRGEVTPGLLTRTLLHAIERHRMLRELTEAQQRQHFMATHDALTGLPNRSAFVDALESAIADARRRTASLAVLFIDLDGFKAVNDKLGHAAGDELLIDAARRVRKVIRKSDMVARLGGDEFVASIRNLQKPETAWRVAESIREELARTFHVGGFECWVGSSVGIALFPNDAREASPLIQAADAAMYDAKGAGRNQTSLYRKELNDRAAARFDLVNGLREAIRDGNLELELQPQVDVATEEIIAAETLLRWRHPTRGRIPPSEFIALAEETGMMVPLGEWVLRSACGAAANWKQFPELRIAVNVSERQLEQPEFPDRVLHILGEVGLAPQRLELELTESLAARPPAVEALQMLRDQGVRVALDDFGTGFSSLTLLERLPIDTLKIDQAFVRGLHEGGRAGVILENVVRMAQGLGLAPLAEGVETLEEMDTLLGYGCHRMQGYLLSKPVPKNDFESMMIAPDAPWRMAIERPESWSPPDLTADEVVAPPRNDEVDFPVLKD